MSIFVMGGDHSETAVATPAVRLAVGQSETGCTPPGRWFTLGAASGGRAIRPDASTKGKSRRIDPVQARLRESARPRPLGSLGLCFVLLLLAGPGPLAAQESTSRPIPASADDGRPAPGATASSTRPSPIYRLLPDDAGDHEPWIASARLETGPPLTLGQDPKPPTLSVWPTRTAPWRAACPTDQPLSD